MAKIHTRVKRNYDLNSHNNHYKFFHPDEKVNGPRTFKTEEAANKYAAENKIKDFTLEKVKHGKKFMISK
ncbi:hypothetical protein ACFLZX_06500 [Nanoarchaeota archaeon]